MSHGISQSYSDISTAVITVRSIFHTFVSHTYMPGDVQVNTTFKVAASERRRLFLLA